MRGTCRGTVCADVRQIAMESVKLDRANRLFCNCRICGLTDGRNFIRDSSNSQHEKFAHMENVWVTDCMLFV